MMLIPPDYWTPEEKRKALERFREAEQRLLSPDTPEFIRKIALPKIRKHINELTN